MYSVVRVVPWFSDAGVVGHLPPQFRLFAAYCQTIGNRETGAVRGGAMFHRLLASATRTFGWSDTAVIDVQGVRLAVDLLDLRMLEAIDEVRRESREVRILRSAIGPGDTFLDVGANHGTYAVQLATSVGPSGRVVAFEPQPRLAAVIRRSFAENGYRQASVLEIGCGERSGTANFYIPSGHSGPATLYVDYGQSRRARQVTVRTERLDDILAGEALPGRVAMKLDVEGAEVAALRGAARLLRDRRPFVLFEVNADSLRAAGQTLGDLVRVFRDAGYSRYSELETYPETKPLDEMGELPQRNVVAR